MSKSSIFLSYCKIVITPTMPENKTCTSDDECGNLDPTGTYCGDSFWGSAGDPDPKKDLPRCKQNEKPCLDPTGIYGCLDPTGIYGCRPLTLNEYKTR